ncbi:MAG: TolC family protein [Candidatus Methylumidiphilus sp.]
MRNIAKILLASMVTVCAASATAANLLELYDQALATNPTLKGKEYMVDQAKAQKDQAMSKLLPQISAIGNLSWSNLAQVVPATAAARQTVDTVSYEGTRGLVQARQALFDLPSYLRLQGAGLTIQQTELELQATHMAVAADLVERYFLVLEATDEMSAIEGEKALTEGDIKRIRRMHELQLAPVTDQLEIEAYYQTLLTHEIEIENARLVGLEKLRELAGVPVAAIAPLVKEVLPDVPGKIDEWVVESTQKNPTLIALQYAINAAEKIIAGARAEHLPQVALQLSETYADNGGFDNRQLPRYTVGTVGLQLTVPIYSGGGTEATVREAIARYQIAGEKRAEKFREIEREARTAYLDAKAGRARIESTRREVEAREKARDAQQRSYELGVATIVALLKSKKNLLKARFEHARARYVYIRSLTALRLWAGSLSRESLEGINAWLAKAG